MNQVPVYHCNNCGKEGHSASRCTAPGGGLAGRTPQRGTQGQFNSFNNTSKTPNPIPQNNSVTTMQSHTNSQPKSANLAEQNTKDIVMMASIEEINESIKSLIHLSNPTSALLSIEDNTHVWLLYSGASSHLCGNLSLFETIHVIPPITIQTANGDSFTANQQGTIKLTIQTNYKHFEVPDLPITLMNVIYVPKLNANLFSVGHMTNANVDVNFSKNYSYLSMDQEILAYGPKINNLFVYTTISTSKSPCEQTYHAEVPNAMLWHHRLAHTNINSIEKMFRLHIVNGVPPYLNVNDAPLCADCPFGKQTRAPFKKIESNPLEIGSIIASDVCGPFKTSINGFKYFLTWIDLKTRYTSIEFLKNKECATITESFK